MPPGVWWNRRLFTVLIVSLVLFIIFGAICGVVFWPFSLIPLIGVIFIAAGALVSLYVLIGIILSVPGFTKVVE